MQVHGVFELFLLSFLAVDILLRFCWFRARQFFHHRRTLFIVCLQGLCVCVCVCDAVFEGYLLPHSDADISGDVS